MNVIIINGPNLNLLGKRNPDVYGDASFEDFFKILKKSFHAINLDYYQSNVEGELINKIQEVLQQADITCFSAQELFEKDFQWYCNEGSECCPHIDYLKNYF